MWYKTGSIAVTSGSTAVTGSGTAWIANTSAGEALYGPDGRFYEIASISSDTSITLATAYAGTSLSGQTYTIMPSQSYIRDLANEVAALVNFYSDIASTTGVGKFDDGTISAPGISFTNDTDTGIRRTASGTFRLVSNGADIAEISPDGLKPIAGLIAPSAASPVQTAEGSLVWDSDDDALTIGTGSTRKTLADAAVLSAHTGNTSNPHSTTKAQVGLGNVDNTSDANKPVSIAQQAYIDGVNSAIQAELDTKDAIGQAVRMNPSTLTTDLTIASGYNALSAGPLAIAEGITVTVSPNATWVVV